MRSKVQEKDYDGCSAFVHELDDERPLSYRYNFEESSEKFSKFCDTESQWKLAEKALADNNEQEALFWCRMAADQMHPAALGQLANMHHEGLGGLRRDYNKSFLYYKQASDLGNLKSMLQLGKMYEDGVGCERNYREAARLYRALARINCDPEALFSLGNLYMMGDGAERNAAKAFILWEKASASGHEMARSFISLREIAFQQDLPKKAIHPEM